MKPGKYSTIKCALTFRGKELHVASGPFQARFTNYCYFNSRNDVKSLEVLITFEHYE